MEEEKSSLKEMVEGNSSVTCSLYCQTKLLLLMQSEPRHFKKQEWHTKQLFLYHRSVFLCSFYYIQNFYVHWKNTFCREDQYVTSAGFSRMSDAQSSGNSGRLVLGLLLKQVMRKF